MVPNGGEMFPTMKNHIERPTKECQLQRYAGMARLLDITERHLANLVKQNKVPVIRMGSSVRFDAASVIEALKG